MSDQTLMCPHCQQAIPLSQALAHQLHEEVEKKLETEKKRLLRAQQEYEAKMQLQQQQQIEELAKQKAEWEQKLHNQKKILWQEALAKAEEKQHTQLRDMQEQIAEQTKRLKESAEQELALRRKTRELEERERQQALEMERKLDEERKKIVEETKRFKDEEQRLKMAEKDKQMEILKKTIEDLKRQSEQGSMQVQGEVQEDDLKSILQAHFPKDLVEDVPTGKRGADLTHTINGQVGMSAGVILWESKNAQDFSQQWPAKLKADQGFAKADIAVLVSKVLPKEITAFGYYKGVWVTSLRYAVPLASILRLHLTELSQAKHALVGRDEKMEMLYRYLSGPEFRNRVENMVMSFVQMKDDLEAEKRSFHKMWSKRDKQIEKLLFGTSGMYGDLQGIIGGALPDIQHLELGDGGMQEMMSGGEK